MLLLLIRHGSTDETAKRLVGRTAAVHLNEAGQLQAEAVVRRLEGVAVDRIYSSPIERAWETAAPLATARSLQVEAAEELSEVDYGEWAGQEFKVLRRNELWKRVTRHPAGVQFPGGESLYEAQARAIGWIEHVAAAHPRATVAAVSHGDIVRMAVAHVVGLNLDSIQRLAVSPGSVSAVAVRDGSGILLTLNELGSLAAVLPQPRGRRGQN